MMFGFYKKGQGYYTRLCTALAGGVLSILGCYALYLKLEGLRGAEAGALGSWLRVCIPLVLFAILAFTIFKMVNMHKFADFMISTEGEMKKVSWSSKKEIIGSTKIVIITVFTLAILLACVDFGFAWLFRAIGVLPKI